MKWFVLILNLVAAAFFVFLAGTASNAHAAHAYSTYRGLVLNHVIAEHPTDTNGQPVDVEVQLRRIGATGD
jgi:ABC-type transport system involved in cytochrome bd biosynthesis fused ATPase/permease subunit